MNDQQMLNKIKSVTVPKGLAKNLKKISQQPARQVSWVSWVASLSLVILLGSSYQAFNPTTPGLVQAALADVKKDASLANGLSDIQKTWLASHQVQLPPQADKVEMSKHCIVSGYVTSHLRIAGEHQGVAHLFLYPGDLNLAVHAGKIDDLNWVNLKVNQGMSLLVMYTDDMRKEGINAILQSMFPLDGIVLT